MLKNRTSIPHFPEELWEKIFSGFEERDLLNCQRVCKAWYKSAHLKLLNSISLHNILIVHRFINSIDSNPDPAYLKAVTKIQIANVFGAPPSLTCPPFTYSEETLHKLLFRFPNLVYIKTCVSSRLLVIFTDKLCETLLQCCPNLEDIIVRSCRGLRYDIAAWNLRLLLTNVEPCEAWPEGISNNVDYITSFPRVRQLKWDVCFEELLQILEKSPYLMQLEMSMRVIFVDFDHALQAYLSTKTQQEQDLLLKRLSNITVLRGHIFYRNENSIDSVLKYFTGLKTIELFDSMRDLSYLEYWRKFVDLGDAVDEVDVSDSLTISEFMRCYYHIANTVYRQPATCQDSEIRRLEFQVTHEPSDDSVDIYTSFRRKIHKRSMRINALCLQCQGTAFSKFCDQQLNINEFSLSFRTIPVHKHETGMYYNILKAMPSLKRVIFDVPGYFKKELEDIYSDFTHPVVEELTLRGRVRLCLDGLTLGFYRRLPNLKHLILIQYCGRWGLERHRELPLNDFSLESLSIDVEPIKYMMEWFKGSDFFVVRLRKGERLYVYKVDLSLLTYRPISPHEIILAKDYVTLDITIADVQKLRFFTGKDKYTTHCNFDVLKRARHRTCLTISCWDDHYYLNTKDSLL